PAHTSIHSLSLPDALPISRCIEDPARQDERGGVAAYFTDRAHNPARTIVIAQHYDGRDRTCTAHPFVGRGIRRDTVEALAVAPRSEEHTSELQSRENLVCR